jgi:hypothetical protein
MKHQQSAKTVSHGQFTHFLPEISDRIQQAAETYLESFNEHQAFSYVIAELYETTQEDRFVFTDGPKDGGIDFIVRDSPSYMIAQCKCPTLADLNALATPPCYDQAVVDELLAAVNMLRDKSGEYDVKVEVRRLRGDYQRDLATDAQNTHLTAMLAVLGELSGQARQYFEAQKAVLAEQEVHLKLVEWRGIDQAVHAIQQPADIAFSIQLDYDDEKDLLAHDNYCYLLAHAFDFYLAFTAHEWALFDWNVRYQIPNSPVNKRIVATLQTARGRKTFHHYNNGLLITCKSYRIDSVRHHLTLSAPQIVNGCQTVRAICEAYLASTPVEQQELREKTRVQVKVIRTTDLEFIGELVISTNDQNPMQPRNLKSNSSEQRNIQKSFRTLPKSWFYQRKDGEFASLASSSGHVPWFHKTDFAAGPQRFRIIDNKDLAKNWYAFTGHSDRAMQGGVDYFAERDESLYNTVFRSIPNPAFWSAFKEPTFAAEAMFFEPGVPSPYQYLLAVAIAKYIDSRRVSFRKNRDLAVLRAIQSGALKGDPNTGVPKNSAKEVDEYLNTDADYFLNNMVNNSKEVLLELYSFILCRKYSECSAVTSQAIWASFPAEAAYLESAFLDTISQHRQQDGASLFGPIYEFLVDCMKQYYFQYEAEIKAAPRLKSYLWLRSTANRMRGLVLQRDQSIVQWDPPWKVAGKTFIASLPKLKGS